MWYKIADVIGTDENNVEDQLLSDDRWDYIEKFFAANGSKSLMFYYQEVHKVDNTCRTWKKQRLFLNKKNHAAKYSAT